MLVAPPRISPIHRRRRRRLIGCKKFFGLDAGMANTTTTGSRVVVQYHNGATTSRSCRNQQYCRLLWCLFISTERRIINPTKDRIGEKWEMLAVLGMNNNNNTVLQQEKSREILTKTRDWTARLTSLRLVVAPSASKVRGRLEWGVS